MLLLIGFAFLAGVVTIASPCILPILPIVLSGAVGGKRKPFGVIVGFVLSFTIFTLFLSALVSATGISADALRLLAVVVLLFAGVSFLIPQIQAYLEKWFSKMASLVQSRTPSQTPSTGFWSGMIVGFSLGLIWTPCVGPILASVISLALTGEVTSSAFFITLAYALGTALPMFAVMYGGRALLQRIPGLLTHLGIIQKVFGVLMIVVALAIMFNFDRQFQTYILEKFPNYGTNLTKFENNAAVEKNLEKLQSTDAQGGSASAINTKGPMAPELIPGGQWFNLPADASALTMQELRGKVVLVDFWTYTCINCIRTLPYLKAWHEKYQDKGLVIIGVHAPEFEFEKNPKNVEKAIGDFKLKYPVMQDNNFATWRAYQNRYWPAKYLIDSQGRVRFSHFGEGEYDETEAMIQQLLREADPAKWAEESPVIQNPAYRTYGRTPETYLGYERMEFFSSPEKPSADEPAQYSIPSVIPPHTFAFGGFWTMQDERSVPQKNARLDLRFEAQEVFLVMRPLKEKSGALKVSLDGKPIEKAQAGDDVADGLVEVSSDRLYKLIKLPKPGAHTLNLEFLDGNVELYAFTFG